MALIFCPQECCILCLFGNNFAKQGNVLTFRITGFTDWKNAKGTKCGALPVHKASDSHKDAAMKAHPFKDVCDGRLKHIHCSTSEQHDEQVRRNREIFYNRYCNCSWQTKHSILGPQLG